jgi:hypothetical protein
MFENTHLRLRNQLTLVKATKIAGPFDTESEKPSRSKMKKKKKVFGDEKGPPAPTPTPDTNLFPYDKQLKNEPQETLDAPP